MKTNNSRQDAFTLIELLVGVAIVAVLAALAQFSAGVIVQNAKQTQSLANMRSITNGLLSFSADYHQQLPSLDPDSATAWDVQILPYLTSGVPQADGDASQYGIARNVFRCALDQRQPDAAGDIYPRSYGLTGVAMNVSGEWTGGIANRQPGEGIRLVQISQPSKFVMLCRIPRHWEVSGNVVGEPAWLATNGPPPSEPGNPNWSIFRGKTPYGFADGHVALLDPEAAQEVDPHFWNSEI